ncbi:hypothetical protein SMICM17S_00235 [Streptomyces microflavus]
MKKLSLRTRVLTGTVAVAALGAGTFGAVSASASAPAAAPAAAVKADTNNRNLQQSTHLTVAAATKAAQATLDAAKKENQRVSVAVVDRNGNTIVTLRGDEARSSRVGVNVPDGNGTVEVIDTASREVTGTAPVGRRPFDVDVSPDGREVYATDHDSFDVTAVDARTLKTRRMEVAPYGTEGGLGSWLKPHYAVVRPRTGSCCCRSRGSGSRSSTRAPARWRSSA